MARKKVSKPGVIARNRRARFDFELERTFEAGIVLEGWEVKSIRSGKASLVDSYVTMHDGEAFLNGTRIEPLASASTHVVAAADRSRKLLLHDYELGQIYSAVQTRGRTCIALSLYWKGSRVKCEIALATGRKKYDKRRVLRERDLKLEQQRDVRESSY